MNIILQHYFGPWQVSLQVNIFHLASHKPRHNFFISLPLKKIDEKIVISTFSRVFFIFGTLSQYLAQFKIFNILPHAFFAFSTLSHHTAHFFIQNFTLFLNFDKVISLQIPTKAGLILVLFLIILILRLCYFKLCRSFATLCTWKSESNSETRP